MALSAPDRGDPALRHFEAKIRLLERREDYSLGSVPAGGLLLTAGADVQKDRIEVSIWAFGRGKESWLVEHRVLMGDTARDAVWKHLGELVAETWTHASGARLPLARLALDTGFATQEAYTFVRLARDPRVMAVKGSAKGAALVGTPTAVDATTGGKKLRRGIKLFTVAVGIAKLEFYNSLRKVPEVAEDGVTIRYPTGFVHLPKVDSEYLQQLCAEQLVTRRDRNGYPVREWQKMRERNEALDCRVYAYAALHGLLSMGLNLNKRVEALPPIPASRQSRNDPRPVTIPMTASPRRRRMAISSNYV